jgi:hypothetical protein
MHLNILLPRVDRITKFTLSRSEPAAYDQKLEDGDKDFRNIRRQKETYFACCPSGHNHFENICNSPINNLPINCCSRPLAEISNK